MNFEKKYKVALGNARQEYNTTENVEIKQFLEELFPELVESEDERIKNKLIKLIKMSSEVGGFALHKWEADEMLTWLEKQNTVKFNDEKDERIRKELLEHCKNQTKPYIQTGNKCPQIQSWIAWLEKQGEQMKTPEESLDISSDKWNDIVDRCLFD